MPIQIDKRMSLLYEDVTPLTTISMKLAKKPVPSMVFYHREDQPLPHRLTYNAASETTALTQVVYANFNGGSSVIIKGKLLYIPRSGETIKINSDTTNQAANVSRDIYTVGGSPLLLQGDTVLVFSTAAMEGDTSFSARHTLEVLKTFGLQNFRYSSEITAGMESTETYHGADREYQRKKLGITAKIEWELTSLFGKYSADVGSGSYRQSTTSGLNEHCTENLHAMPDGSFTYAEFENAMAKMARYHLNGKGWFYLCPLKHAQIINGWARSQAQTTLDKKTYGNRIKTLETTYGDVEILPHPLLYGSGLETTGWFIPKPWEEYIQCRYQSGNGKSHDWKIWPDVQANDSELIKDEIRGRYGLEFWDKSKFGKISNALY